MGLAALNEAKKPGMQLFYCGAGQYEGTTPLDAARTM